MRKLDRWSPILCFCYLSACVLRYSADLHTTCYARELRCCRSLSPAHLWQASPRSSPVTSRRTSDLQQPGFRTVDAHAAHQVLDCPESPRPPSLLSDLEAGPHFIIHTCPVASSPLSNEFAWQNFSESLHQIIAQPTGLHGIGTNTRLLIF